MLAAPDGLGAQRYCVDHLQRILGSSSLLLSKNPCATGSYEEHSVRLNKPSQSLIPITGTGHQSDDQMVEQVLVRDQRVCQMCGADESCKCPYTGTQVSLFVRCLETTGRETKLDPDQMRTICSTCADGLRTAFANRRQPSIARDRLQLLAQIRRATITDQKEVLDWLLQKFKLKAEKL